MNGIIFTLLTLGVLGVAALLFMFMVECFGKPSGKTNHSFWGYRTKPVKIVRNDGDERYAIRVYRMWGLVPTKYYLREGSEYRDWSTETLERTRTIVYDDFAQVKMALDRLKPKERLYTVEETSLQELEMEKLLDDK